MLDDQKTPWPPGYDPQARFTERHANDGPAHMKVLHEHDDEPFDVYAECISNMTDISNLERTLGFVLEALIHAETPEARKAAVDLSDWNETINRGRECYRESQENDPPPST